MLTNEQRAHDYALAVLPIAIEKAKEERQQLRDESEVELALPKIDSFEIYLSIYEKSLERLENQ